MEKLNQFETAILEKLAIDNPIIKKHIPFLTVKERKLTAGGMYIHLNYLPGSEKLEYIQRMHLSTTGYLKMQGLEDGLIDNLKITNGRIDIMELVTYGEAWDGVIRDFFWDEKL
jgi:hypothetical protein